MGAFSGLDMETGDLTGLDWEPEPSLGRTWKPHPSRAGHGNRSDRRLRSRREERGQISIPVDEVSVNGGLELMLHAAGRWWAGLWVRLCSGTDVDTLQTPDDRFPPTQSSGVWEVYGAVVISSDPE